MNTHLYITHWGVCAKVLTDKKEGDRYIIHPLNSHWYDLLIKYPFPIQKNCSYYNGWNKPPWQNTSRNHNKDNTPDNNT